MAARTPFALPKALRCMRPSAPRAASRFVAHRFYSTPTSDAASSPPPMLQKLKTDLKTAMRAKDAPRLTVLRAIMSENLNLSKTTSPIKTDLQLVALIRRLKRGAEDAAAEAGTAGREDLVAKEQEQARIFGEYMAGSGVQTVAGAELENLVRGIVDECKKAAEQPKNIVKDVMGRMAKATEGKDVDRKEVARMVKEFTSS